MDRLTSYWALSRNKPKKDHPDTTDIPGIMRKLLVLVVICLFAGTTMQAQRANFAYVNTDYILGQMEEYTAAQVELDKLAEDWRRDIAVRKAEIEAMYRDFTNDRVLLTEEQEVLRTKEIEAKETDLKDFQRAKFGYEGEMFEKRQELIKPIQDRVYGAIEELAKDRGYDFVFDQANSTTLLFANIEKDKSDDILKKMGITSNR
ncbi:MAG: outer membrane protein [Limisphaerales bacterium]|jgi:outer membrane protein